ncbi:tyrosine-protein phosphatase non-receptor type 2-like isoform X1 [Argiope bruennichi]|uniref:tyrosine-protein phosphatase non-receptor type 2-like isoform X1 n=1 Tax=Argiope bruennichi TaxID=94029 RepID=UPI002494456B|nr:tyrosine-protein phosphatase non-receptor type 2-like isoform X1 [Argiope bruennichi]
MEVEFYEIDRKNAWNTIFQEIRNESNNFTYIIKDAKKLENKNLNRYRDVNPFDHSRVRLQRGDKDYINASLVEVPSADRSYILTQGPLPVTTGHFWLMVWEQKSKAILMLNRIIEKNTVKCHQYWPVGSENGGSDDLILRDVNLKITFLSQKNESNYVVRNFLITDLESENSREILQFHYTTWPDFGVPESPEAFLNFLFSVRASGVLNSNYGPPVVHCSAGIGRSGTFCLVDSCLVLIEKNNDPNSINIRQQLLEMRHYRMGLIQTPDQLRFSYVAIIEGAKRVLSMPNVPSGNENLSKTHKKICFSSENCNITENTDDSDVSPPPLPPRSRNSDDLSPSIQTDINNFSELNGDIMNSDSSLSSMKQSESDAIINSEENNQYSCKSRITDEEMKQSITGTSFNSSVSPALESLTELRKRVRKEREEKTALMVQNIKKKQKEAELWEKRRSIIKLSLGLVLIIGIGYFVYKNYSKS